MRIGAALTIAFVACSGSDEPRYVVDPRYPITGEFPHTMPPIARDVVAMEGSNARLYDVRGMDFPDSCLGIKPKAAGCLAVVTRGYRVIVERDGMLVAYHTGATAGIIRAGVIGPVSDFE